MTRYWKKLPAKLKSGSITSINFVPLGKYFESVKTKFRNTGTDRIAMIYAEGNIVGGKNSQKEIGQDIYRSDHSQSAAGQGCESHCASH